MSDSEPVQQAEAEHANGKLFRYQALDTKKQKLYGNVLLIRPLSFRILTFGTVFVTAAIIAFFFKFGFTRKETVMGVLVPQQGLARVFSPQNGMLVRSEIHDGQAVSKDDVLFVLSSEVVSSRGATQQNIGFWMRSRINSLQKELAQLTTQNKAQQTAIDQRNVHLSEQFKKIKQEITLQHARVEMANASAKRFQNLKNSNFSSDAQVQEKQAELIDQQSRLAALERTAVSLRSEITALENEQTQNVLNSHRQAEQLTREIAEIEQGETMNEAQRQFVVRSPKAGIVTAITVEPGQLVAPNLPLASIVPAYGDLEAELYAPSRAIGFIKTGTGVLLRYQAFPYQKFGQQPGVIREISRSPLHPSEITAPLAHLSNAQEPLYRIRVKLGRQRVKTHGRTAVLQPGMQLEGSLLLEHRKLAEWIIDPIYTLTGRL